MLPGVAEALSDVGEVLVGGDGGGNARIEIQRVGEGRSPLVGVPEAVENAVAVRQVGDVAEAAEAAAGEAVVDLVLADSILIEQVLDLVPEGDVDQCGPIVCGPAVHEGGQGARAIVVPEPIGAAAFARDDVPAGGVGVPPEARAVVEGEVLREILGLHGDVGASPIGGKVGRLGLDHHQVVHEVGREQVHFDGVSARVDGGDLGPVERGLQVPVGQAADEDEVAHGGDAGDALHGAGRIAVPGALDLLAGDVVDAGRRLFLDVLHVDVPGPVHLGHDLGSLLDDEGLREQVEVDDDHLVSGDGDGFGDRSASDEAARHAVGSGSQAGQVEIAVEVGHGTHGRSFYEGAGANERFTGLSVRDLAPDGALGGDQKGEGTQEECEQFAHGLRFYPQRDGRGPSALLPQCYCSAVLGLQLGVKCLINKEKCPRSRRVKIRRSTGIGGCREAGSTGSRWRPGPTAFRTPSTA